MQLPTQSFSYRLPFERRQRVSLNEDIVGGDAGVAAADFQKMNDGLAQNNNARMIIMNEVKGKFNLNSHRRVGQVERPKGML